MENKTLKNRAMRREHDMMRVRDRAMDSRNPYGSRGGYVDSRRGRPDRMDSRSDYSEYDSRDYRGYDSRYDYEDGHYPMERPREYYGPRKFEMYGMTGRPEDFANYDYAKEEDSYKKDLEDWIHKLKKKDRFGLDMHQIIDLAKQMGVKFDEFSKEEFFAIYLAMVTDHPKVSNEPRFFVSLAKDFFDDDDTAKRNSEKVCAYLYYIVLGED